MQPELVQLKKPAPQVKVVPVGEKQEIYRNLVLYIEQSELLCIATKYYVL